MYFLELWICDNSGPCCNSGPARALSQAAGLVVTGSLDRTLCVWRLADGACLRTFTGHTGLVDAVVDVGGGRVATEEDGVLRVWDVLSGKQLQQTPTGEGWILCAALCGDRVATAGHQMTGEIRLWSLGNGGRAAGVLRGHADIVNSLAVVGSGTAQRLLASGSNDCSVRLWDVDAGTCTAVLIGHTNFVLCLADLGGGRLLSGSWGGSLRVWNTATRACLALVPNAHGEGDIEVFCTACALPCRAATGSRELGTVQWWKWDEGASALTPDGAALQVGGDVMRSLAAAPGPDGAQKLLVGCVDGTVSVLGDGGVGGALQQQAELAGHSDVVSAVAVMMP